MSRRITERIRRPDAPPPAPQRIIVIGHKNPDTDAIASATGYAELKRLQGFAGAEAACAGLPSTRTEFLFKRFDVPMPPTLGDVHPRVKDVLETSTPTLSAGHTLLEAFSLLQKTRQHRIPVVDAKGIHLGMVSLFDLADRMVIQAAESDYEGKGGGLVGREINTSIAHIIEVLHGRALALHREGIVEALEVYVGAMSEKLLRERMNSRDPRHAVLVVGDRAEIHRIAVEAKLRLLIVTGNLPVDDALVEKARAVGTSIVQTPFDSGTTVRRLKFSAPVELMLQENVGTFGPEEKLSDARDAIIGSGEQVFPVVDEREKLLGVLTREGLERELPLKLILVDHNELAQAIDGADEVPIIEILDHHRLGMQQTQTPITVTNEVVGSSCTLVTEQYRRFGHTPSAKIAGILMGGVIADTLMLRSPTTTPRDEAVLKWLQELSGTDAKQLSDEMLSVGSSIASQPARNVIRADKKDYSTARYKFAVAQVEEIGFEHFFEHRGELLKEMRNLRRDEKLDVFALLVTNVVRETSMMLCVGEKRVLDRINYTRLDESTFDLPGVMSRKKQLLPQLLKVMS
jgi:manganese-dependent inorganic pyrophosphatase